MREHLIRREATCMREYTLNIEWEYAHGKTCEELNVSAVGVGRAVEEGERYAATNYDEDCLDFSVTIKKDNKGASE